MDLNIKVIASKLRDTTLERELASQLRKMPEEQRFQFIEELMYCGLPNCFAVGMWLTKTCLNDRLYLEKILLQGLIKGDASSIKHWIEAVIDQLGFRRVSEFVNGRLNEYPEAGVRARYWLKQMIPHGNQRAKESFSTLDQNVDCLLADDTSLLKRAKPFLPQAHDSDAGGA